MGKEYDDIKKRVAELASKRDRTGKDPLPVSERIQVLNEIYDGLLFLWKQAVITGTAKGTGAICLQLERARLEIHDLKRFHGAELAAGEEKIIGWEDHVFSDSDETGEPLFDA